MVLASSEFFMRIAVSCLVDASGNSTCSCYPHVTTIARKQHYDRLMKNASLVLGLSIAIAVMTCPFSRGNSQQTKSDSSEQRLPQVVRCAVGEVVSDIGDSCWYVFQDRNNNYWFGSDGQG